MKDKLINGAKNKKNIVRWACFGSGIVLLLLFNLQYVFPWADIYFGATILYMVVLLSYVVAKAVADRLGVPYSKTRIGEWLGIIWIVNFAILWILKAVLTAFDPIKYQAIPVVPEEMAWVAGETAMLFIFSDLLSYSKKQQ